MKHSPAYYREVKTEAKRLITTTDMLQKEIAKKVGVAEKTMSYWVKKYKWINDKHKELYQDADPLIRYIRYLQDHHPSLYKQINKTFELFLKGN